MYVNSRIQLWASLIQVYYGFNRQRPGTLCPVKGEVPALAAGVPALEPEGAAEEHSEGAVGAHLGECAFLPGGKSALLQTSGCDLVCFLCVYIYDTDLGIYFFQSVLVILFSPLWEKKK